MFFAAPAKFLVVLRPGNGTPNTFLCRLRVSAMPPASPARLAAATNAGVLSFLAVDPTASPAPVATLTDASLAFSAGPLLLEERAELDCLRAVDPALLGDVRLPCERLERDELDCLRFVDPALLCAVRLPCERLELDRDLVVRVFVDELRGLELPPLDLRVLLPFVCAATGPLLKSCRARLPRTRADSRNLRVLVEDLRSPIRPRIPSALAAASNSCVRGRPLGPLP
jgi:hypothetical protein